MTDHLNPLTAAEVIAEEDAVPGDPAAAAPGTDPHVHEAIGAGAGALGGAVIGLALGGPVGAIVGGVLGAIGGEAAGEKVDDHKADDDEATPPPAPEAKG
jgi:phage tail tape-measure protein